MKFLVAATILTTALQMMAADPKAKEGAGPARPQGPELANRMEAAQDTDWPQWLGPNRNGTCSGAQLASSWPKEGPPQRWKQAVGEGFSSPVVAGAKLILFHRLKDQETVSCLEARTGQLLWEFQYPTRYDDDFGFDEGPRATPTMSGDRVYTLGAEGMVHCLNLADGQPQWQVDTKKTFRAPKGFFGMACSPLVAGNAVMVNIGGTDRAGIVAFHKETGKLLWKATSAEASYSSPVSAMIANRQYAFFLNREGLVALDPGNGRVFFEFPWRPAPHASVSAATPLVIDDRVFISTSYGRGAALLQLGGEAEPETIWTAEDALSNHYSTSVHHEGFLYGFHGRQEQGCILRCVKLSTGRVQWSASGLGAGSILLAGDALLILTEGGEFIRAPATPRQFQPTARSQILGFQVRAYPALAQGLFFARDKRNLVCLDLASSSVSP